MFRPWLLVGFASTALFLLPSVSLHAADVGKDVVFEQGIEYSNPDNQHLQLNLARPSDAALAATAEKLPAVVCIHGGGFRAGERNRWNDLCKKLAARGYVAVTVTYRLAPKYQFPAAVYDVKAAVRWLKTHADKFHIDPERIASLGDSAGGHLAQFLGVTGDVPQFEGETAPGGVSSRVACVVNYYGPSDFTKSYGKSVDAAEVLPLFLGGDLEHARHRHIIASPINWVTPDAAPTLLLHGTQDQYVNYEQAIWMRDRLKSADVEVELVSFEGAKHGFGGQDAQRAEQAALEFLDRHLKAK
jgi:acetyl esterase/lipase